VTPLAKALDALGVRTRSGRPWHPQQIARMLKIRIIAATTGRITATGSARHPAPDSPASQTGTSSTAPGSGLAPG
jgi:hypothetical protein